MQLFYHKIYILTSTKCRKGEICLRIKLRTESPIFAEKIFAEIRKSIAPAMSQRALADKIQLEGIDIDKNAVQRIEAGKRFVTDIELIVFAYVLKENIETLLN